jgi:hypothetical protein
MKRDEEDLARAAESKRREAEEQVDEFRAEVEATRQHGVEERAAAAETAAETEAHDRAESDKEADEELGGEG